MPVLVKPICWPSTSSSCAFHLATNCAVSASGVPPATSTSLPSNWVTFSPAGFAGSKVMCARRYLEKPRSSDAKMVPFSFEYTCAGQRPPATSASFHSGCLATTG